MISIRFFDAPRLDGLPKQEIATGSSLRLVISYGVKRPVRNVHFGIELCDVEGNRLISFTTRAISDRDDLCSSDGKIECVVKSLPLSIGDYHVSLFVYVPNQRLIRHEKSIGVISVTSTTLHNSGLDPRWDAAIVPDYSWQFCRNGN